MRLLRQDRWMRHGFSLLWEPKALARVATPDQVLSILGFFAMQKGWPEELPAGGGDALVVAGLEGCLDVLTAEDAVTWLESDLKAAILSFQAEYMGDAALIFWLPSGRKRIGMQAATEHYTWSLAVPPPEGDPTIAIGRCLFAGAESDLARILVSDDPSAGEAGPAYAGLYHPRIS